jgi:hypothetical protein
MSDGDHGAVIEANASASVRSRTQRIAVGQATLAEDVARRDGHVRVDRVHVTDGHGHDRRGA